jgi:uncharacterized protein YjbI with pentapeptide repeats
LRKINAPATFKEAAKAHGGACAEVEEPRTAPAIRPRRKEKGGADTLDNPRLRTQIEDLGGGRWAGMAEPETKDVDALLAALNGSAERFQTLWFSFLGLTVYLAITALATTHRNLLLNEPQTLPLLNIKVELLPFYFIAPLLFLVFHFYLLMMLVLLARTAAEFESELRKTLPGTAKQERYRARVENALFLQLLVGMAGERVGFNSFLLAAIAVITIVLAPVATLILVQMMFLPDHNIMITWWHRLLVIIDVGTVLTVWHSFVHNSDLDLDNPLLKRELRLPFGYRAPLRDALLLSLNFGVIAVAFWLSFWEGRWAGEPRIGRREFAATENGVVFGLFPDRLKLNDEKIVGEAKLEETKKEIASRGGTDFVPTIKLDRRDLQAANLSGADLRGVSLSGAAMRGINLTSARLDGARLTGAQLQDAWLYKAGLAGADLKFAQLQGANLAFAHLQGADLDCNPYPGDTSFCTSLQGADLSYAESQGANLEEVQMEGASLQGAKLQGAFLWKANLRGATLRYAELEGAELTGAHLQGVNLDEAQLQGVNLTGAEMADNSLNRTFVWGTDSSVEEWSKALIRAVRTDRVKHAASSVEPLTPEDVEAWIAAATQFAPSKEKDSIAKRFDRLKKNFQAADQDAADVAKWKSLEDSHRSSDPNGAQHRQRLANFLGELACEPADAPYVARGLILNSLEALGDQLGDVRSRMNAAREKPEACKGVAGFTEDDWRKLDAIKS